MSWPYGDVYGFFLRFPKVQVSSAEVSSFFLYDASAWLDERLSKAFAVPFSSNNFTATRLTYMKALHLIRLRTINPGDSKEIADEIEKGVNQLLSGSAAMLQLDPVLGPVPLWGSVVQVPGQAGYVLSGDDAYGRTFGLDSALTNYPDSNRVDDTVLGRPSQRPNWQDEL